MVIFGIAAQGSGMISAPLVFVADALSRRAGFRVVPRACQSYAELSDLCRSGELGAAWLPPIVFLDLERSADVSALLSNARSGSATYRSVIVVRDDARFRCVEDLATATIAWVDPWSTSGYVLPRIELADRGVLAATASGRQTFFGTHRAAIRAVAEGSADATATFAHRAADGTVERSGWHAFGPNRAAFRVLHDCGEVPGDVIGASRSLGAHERDALASAFEAVIEDAESSATVRSLLGIDGFIRGAAVDYIPFRKRVKDAFQRGLIDGLERRLS